MEVCSGGGGSAVPGDLLALLHHLHLYNPHVGPQLHRSRVQRLHISQESPLELCHTVCEAAHKIASCHKNIEAKPFSVDFTSHVFLYGVVISPLQNKVDAGHTVCYVRGSRPHVVANDVENLSVRHFSSESLLASLTTCQSISSSLFPTIYFLFQLLFPHLCVIALWISWSLVRLHLCHTDPFGIFVNIKI